MWVGASVSGSSLTYTNRVDARRDLITFTITDFLNPIEQRLSMRDITPTKFMNIIRFNTNDFLRTDVSERVALVVALTNAGLMNEDEARSFLQDDPNPTTYPS
jgi:phage portal protein BeeE